jgi:uncharacterized LabA/DUF88 family protein
MIDRQRRVVLLIDYDNLQICASRDTPGRDLQLTPVVQLAQRYGTVILARAYAEWNLATERLAVYKAGIEPAFAPVLRTESDRSGKSLADTVMVAEGMDMLWTLSPDVVVLATSDKDLIPLVRVAKQRGAFVVVLGSDFTAIPLREMADEHFTYRGLITEAAGRFATEAGPARQPAALPEPSRRRTRERNGRERSTPAAAVTPTTPAREPVAAPPPAAAAAAPQPAAAAEPVAPTTSGDSEAGAGGRRRRRRGSRRRAERLGQSVDAVGGVETGATGDESAAEEDAQASSIAEVAQASNGTVESVSPAETLSADAAPAESAASPAPRERRRRTRRTSTTETPAAAETTPTEAGEPIPQPTAEAALESPTAPEVTSAETPQDGEAAPAAPRRARRVASASRGRTRPASR